MLASSSTVSSSGDRITVVAVGALAATLAAVSHETLGHGLTCVGAGAHITLLTSIWFRCDGGSALVSAGGPLGNLIAGAAALALLGYARPSARVRLLLVMFGALNLFWFTGELAFESLTNTDDWHYVALQLGWPAIWRTIGAVVGIAGYVLVGRWVSAVIRKQGGPRGNAIRLAYAAAAASAVIAGLMWQPEPLRSALQGFLALGLAPLGLLSAARRASQDAGRDSGGGSVPRWVWVGACAVLFSLFLFMQARGLGSMAASRLSP